MQAVLSPPEKQILPATKKPQAIKTVPVHKDGLLAILPTPITNATGWPWTEETPVSVYNNRKHWPKISIITPSYNQGQFIEQTIRGILLQNYPNLEYIVIDGGSTDNTKAILEKYSPWISYWKSEKDNGQGEAINTGFSKATGEYFAWINSDDYYLKDAFKTVVDKFLSARADFVYGYGYDNNIVSGKRELIKVLPFLDYFIRIPSLVQPSCFWSAKIHQPIWEALNCSLDYELWQRLVKGNKRAIIKKPLSVTNVHEAAKTEDPKMRAAWEKDHQLICSTNAHREVLDWDKRIFRRRIFAAIYKALNLY